MRIEEDVALRRIGVAAGDEGRDHGEHGADVVGGAGLQRGGKGAQGGHLLVIIGGVAVGDDLYVDAFVGGLPVYLVVDVSDVAGIDHRILSIEMAQQAEEDVEDDDGPGVADVDVIIDRGAADIHRHPGRIGGDEVALFAAQGVVKAKGHQEIWGAERLR